MWTVRAVISLYLVHFLSVNSALLLSRYRQPTAASTQAMMRSPSRISPLFVLATYEESTPISAKSFVHVFYRFMKTLFPDFVRIVNLFLNFEKPVNNNRPRPRRQALRSIIAEYENENAKDYYRRQLQFLLEPKVSTGRPHGTTITSAANTRSTVAPVPTLSELKTILIENTREQQRIYEQNILQSGAVINKYPSKVVSASVQPKQTPTSLPTPSLLKCDELTQTVQQAIENKRKSNEQNFSASKSASTEKKPDYIKEWQDYFKKPATPVVTISASTAFAASVSSSSVKKQESERLAIPAVEKPDYIKEWQNYYAPMSSSVAFAAEKPSSLSDLLEPSTSSIPISTVDISRMDSSKFDSQETKNPALGMKEVAAMLLVSGYAYSNAGSDSAIDSQGVIQSNNGANSPVAVFRKLSSDSSASVLTSLNALAHGAESVTAKFDHVVPSAGVLSEWLDSNAEKVDSSVERTLTSPKAETKQPLLKQVVSTDSSRTLEIDHLQNRLAKATFKGTAPVNKSPAAPITSSGIIPSGTSAQNNAIPSKVSAAMPVVSTKSISTAVGEIRTFAPAVDSEGAAIVSALVGTAAVAIQSSSVGAGVEFETSKEQISLRPNRLQRFVRTSKEFLNEKNNFFPDSFPKSIVEKTFSRSKSFTADVFERVKSDSLATLEVK